MNESALEHVEQVTLFRWTDFAANDRRIPQIIVGGERMSVLEFLHAIPNGGYRNKATASKLKAEGVKSGVPDIFLPYPFDNYHGLYIEMKRASGGIISSNQKKWIEYLQSQNYAVCVCRGFEEAQKALLDYLSGEFINAPLKSTANRNRKFR